MPSAGAIRRYWLAEHHNMPGIASAATSVVIGHVAGGTIDDPGRRRRHHAAQPCAAGRSPSSSARWSRCSRAASISASAARPGPTSHRARAAAQSGRAADDRSRRTCSSCRRYFEPAAAGPAGPGGARRRAQRADLDPGLEPVRRAARRGARPALRLRLALRAGAHAAGAGGLPAQASSPQRSSASPTSCSAST